MSGDRKGVQRRILTLVPSAIFTQCYAHSINRSLFYSCQIPGLRNMFSVIEEITKFFTYSPKRSIFLEKIQGEFEHHCQTSQRKVARLCQTRWNYRFDALRSILGNLKAILGALEGLSLMRENPDKDARGLKCSIEKFDFLVAACVAEKLLGIINSLTVGLQAVQLDILCAIEHAKEVVASLHASRSEEAFSKIFNEAKELAELVEVTPSIPRVVGRQTTRPNPGGLDMESYYRVTMFYPFIDHLKTEIEDRLLSQGLKSLSQAVHLMPKYITSASTEKINEMCVELEDMYYEDLPTPSALKGEIGAWKAHCIRKNLKALNLHQSLAESNSGFYPNVKVLFQLLLTLPMTTASAERSFSYLRIIKNHLRNTMGQERLSSVSLLYIHNNIEIDTKLVIEKWHAMKNRRLLLPK